MESLKSSSRKSLSETAVYVPHTRDNKLCDHLSATNLEKFDYSIDVNARMKSRILYKFSPLHIPICSSCISELYSPRSKRIAGHHVLLSFTGRTKIDNKLQRSLLLTSMQFVTQSQWPCWKEEGVAKRGQSKIPGCKEERVNPVDCGTPIDGCRIELLQHTRIIRYHFSKSTLY